MVARIVGAWWIGLWVAGCGDDAADGEVEGPDAEIEVGEEVEVVEEIEVAETRDGDGDDGDDGDGGDGGGDEVYGPREPPAAPIPEVRRAERWVSHWVEDIAPFWTMEAALGSPVGNFPTNRGMNGQVVAPTTRRPRMISRQVFAYAAGYLMTGDEALLGLAEAGVRWLRERAIDPDKGSCFPELDNGGRPIDGVRTAQDHAYCMLGLAAWFYVTRDPEAEAALVRGREELFDPALFWDAASGRVRDALDASMTSEVDLEGDGGWELVAQLDPVNAFLLLTQPVMSEASERARFLEDLERLARVLVDHFHEDGMFWGVHNAIGRYRSKHVDFGHAMKSVWMVREIDKRLPDHPFRELVEATARDLVARAFDEEHGRWSKRPTSASAVEYGSDWWQYAEADQLAATLDLVDGRYDALLASTQASWLEDYVDRVYDSGEVIPGITREGEPVWSWPPGDTAKCNIWKNGYHTSEHALVMAITGAQRAGEEVVLHFAVPAEEVATFTATPYIFHGRELGREAGAVVSVGGRELVEVAVRFGAIW